MNAGYSGTEKDDVSYCLKENNVKMCLGAEGRFVELGNQLISNKRNSTVAVSF